MNKKIKSSVKKAYTLFYLILLIIVILLVTFILFFLIIDNTTIINKSATISSPIIVQEKQIKKNFSYWNKSCDWNLIVINNNNEIPVNFKVNLKRYKDIEIDERIFPDLEKMIQDATYENLDISITSGYRSIETQKILFEKKVSENIQNNCSPNEVEIFTEKSIEKPRTSEHHTGLAIDLKITSDDFSYKDIYKWLVKNSYKYGFILRYNSKKQNITEKPYEPLHLRYIGKSHAKIVTEKCLCLEEYISEIMAQQ